MRKNYSLNYNWKYYSYYSDEMVKSTFDSSGYDEVDIPHNNMTLPLNYFDEKSYQLVSLYQKRFDFEEIDKNEMCAILHFEGVANYARVYLNDALIGEYKGGYTNFFFDVTEHIKEKDNCLAVMVDSTERPEIPPFGNVVDYLSYGGIYREVWLEVANRMYIYDVFVKTTNVLSESKTVDIAIAFSEHRFGKYTVEISDEDKVLFEKEYEYTSDRAGLQVELKDVELWDLDNPKLYNLKVTLDNGDEKNVRFGFREVMFKRNGFYLNGKKVMLLGLNRHQSYPYVGNAMPKSAQRADADLLKYKLGCNMVRTAHYPNSKHFLDRCDEIGLLVFTEIPSWQHIGEGQWRENFIDNVRRMIMRDRNHPSIILWGVRVNEGPDCDELYTKTNKLAHMLDSTRQTGGARCVPRTHLLEDVYTYNDFLHSGGKRKLMPPFIVAGFKAPYFISEHNGHMFPTKSFDRENLRLEHALRHLRVINKAFGNKRTSAVTGWCMADYNTHKDFGSGDRICYHGVTDMFREPKLAAAVYASQGKEPFMEISTNMSIGEFPGGQLGQVYAFTNCDYIKVYKNGNYTSTVYPAKKEFKHIAHPPIIIEDFVGNALVEEDKLNEKAAKHLKKTIIMARRHGFSMPISGYFNLIAAFILGKMKFNDIYNLITKYIANWGDAQLTYTFEGYIDDKKVKTITKTATTKVAVKVEADSETLKIGDTYDVTRVSVNAVDQNNNKLTYVDAIVSLSTKGPVEIIGPKSFSLIGGSRAFWVRTTGEKGVGIISVHSNVDTVKEVVITVE